MIERRLQIAIYHLEEWCDKTGFVFSPSKSVSMHICRKRLCRRMVAQLTLNDTPKRFPFFPWQVDFPTFLGLVLKYNIPKGSTYLSTYHVLPRS